mgnify:CR=1 FL=1
MQLLQGDCLELMKDIPDKSVDMILCDLPYNMTSCKWDKMLDLNELFLNYERIVKNGGVLALFGSEPFSSLLRTAKLDWFKYDWVWAKEQSSSGLQAKSRPLKKHEIISVFYQTRSKSGAKSTYNPQMQIGKPYKAHYAPDAEVHGKAQHYVKENIGTRYPTSILKFNREKGLHPTQKPVPLLEYLIKTYTNEGETVLDNCMGSGSTGVACVNTNRDFIGIELDEHYFEIAKQRIDEAIRLKETELKP